MPEAVGTALDVALVSGGTGFSGGYTGLATAHNSAMYYPDLVDDTISEAVASDANRRIQPRRCCAINRS
jgi:hypothetical protein